MLLMRPTTGATCDLMTQHTPVRHLFPLAGRVVQGPGLCPRGTSRYIADARLSLYQETERWALGAPCGPARLRCLEYVGERLDVWRLALADFDDDLAEGRALNDDLRRWAAANPTKAEHGAAMTFEVGFPREYPAAPFFLRLVRPRMQMYTGHVTAGGAICIQALTQGTAPSCWQQAFSVQGILQLVATNLLDPERVMVRTRTGPGGMSGPARVDFRLASSEYGEGEARAAFARMLEHHRTSGW